MTHIELEWRPVDIPTFPTLPPFDITMFAIPSDRLRIKGEIVRRMPHTDDMVKMLDDIERSK